MNEEVAYNPQDGADNYANDRRLDMTTHRISSGWGNTMRRAYPAALARATRTSFVVEVMVDMGFDGVVRRAVLNEG